MRRLIRWTYILAAILALLAVLNFLLLPQIIVNVLKNQIEVEGSEVTGMKLSVEAVKMNALFPFYIRLQKVRAGGESLAFDVEEVSLRISPEYKKGQIVVAMDVVVRNPQVSLRILKKEEEVSKKGRQENSSESVSTWNHKIFGIPVVVPLRMRWEGGGVKVFYDVLNSLELKSFNFNFFSHSVLDPTQPLQVDIESVLKVQKDPYRFQLPLSIRSRSLRASPEFLEAEDLKVFLGGVESTVRGKTLFAHGSHAWKLILHIPALEKLPVPADFLPPGVWAGGVQGEVDFRQASGGAPEIRTHFQTKNLTGDVEFQREDLSVKGRLKALLAWKLNFIQGEISAPHVSISVSSDDMAISKGKIFKKKPGQALNFQLDGYITKNVLVLNVMKATVDRIRLDAAGFIGLVKDKRSDLTLRIPKTSLEGLEKMFPPLAQQPARGTLSLEARLKGNPFQGVEGVHIMVNPVKLRGFSTSLNFRDDEKKIYIIGPIIADLQARIRSQGTQVGNTTVQGGVDLSQLEISYGHVFQKKMGSPLKLQVRVGNKGQSLSTSGSSLSIDKGILSVSGTVSGFSDPRMRLQLSMSHLPLHQISKMTGFYKGLSGELGGKLFVSGQWVSSKGIEESPLLLNGQLNSSIKHLAIKTQSLVKSQETPDIEVPKLKEVPPLAPSWYVTKNMDVSIKGTIRELDYNDLKVHGISYKARLQKGDLSVATNIQRLFGGKVAVRNFKAPLLRPNPRITLNASMSHILLQNLLEFAMPEYAQEATGFVNLQVDASTEMPSSVRFLSGLKGLVSLDSPNLSVRSLKLNTLINQSLSKIPKVKIKPVKTEGFRGSVSLISAFSNAAVQLNKLDILSVKKDQLNLKGQMDLQGGVHLRGTMSLATPPMGGDIYLCNADKRGRFVVPVNIKGRWNQPNFSFASSTVEALVRKTLTCQARKEKKKFEEKIDRELEDARKKVTKDLEKQAKDKLKGLFK